MPLYEKHFSNSTSFYKQFFENPPLWKEIVFFVGKRKLSDWPKNGGLKAHRFPTLGIDKKIENTNQSHTGE